MHNYAQVERTALCDAALRLGPTAPTLCEGWNVRDLMAHLAMRERRPEAVGIVWPRAAEYTERTRRRYALRPFEDLVDMVRKGPHELSPFQIKALDARANLSEYFIHHEDILRANSSHLDEGSVRELSGREQKQIYELLGSSGRLLLRGTAFSVAALCPGFAPLQLTKVETQAASSRSGAAHAPLGDIVIEGLPSEVLLNLAGRMAFVHFQGDPDDINQYASETRGF